MMPSSGVATTKILKYRHGKQKQKLQQRNKVQRLEIDRLHAVMDERKKKHEAELAAIRDRITKAGAEMMMGMEKLAGEVEGFKDARDRLKRGLISRLWFALGLAWRGRFA